MGKGRLEAFSDGVIAIIITIMVLELKVPHETADAVDVEALKSLKGVFGSYVLSFVFVAIYWNNHHHMLHASERVTGGILWANIHLLFWLSLVPFVTAWMGENHFPPVPVACYGAVMLMCGVAFNLLARMLTRLHGPHSTLALALGRDGKGWASLILYASSIPLAFVDRWISLGIYVLVAGMWLIPDRRIERITNH
jgi:uncharacterized membrane protein